MSASESAILGLLRARSNADSPISRWFFGQSQGARLHAFSQFVGDVAVDAFLDKNGRAEGLHRQLLGRRERVRKHGRELQPQHAGHERQRRSCAAASEFHHRVSGLDLAPVQRARQDRNRHAVLVGSGRIATLKLHPDFGRIVGHKPREPDERRFSNGGQAASEYLQ